MSTLIEALWNHLEDNTQASVITAKGRANGRAVEATRFVQN
jgi:hypothetical protein